MGDREAIIRLATEYMGWKVHGEDAHGMIRMEGPDRSRYHYSVTGEGWNPFTEIADAFELQAAILKRGPKVRRAFTQALNRIVWDSTVPGDGRDWAMIHATPRQRSDAALAVLTEAQG